MSAPQELELSFINSYSALLIGVWTSEAEAAKLAEDPAAYARAKGLPVSPGAVVRVDRTPHEGLFHKDEVIAAWTATPGVHVLYVPDTPVVDLDELEDADLDAVAAGKLNININIVLL
jgi:diadenosine tetraphosphate (Ap4A) HIT family hydrolase